METLPRSVDVADSGAFLEALAVTQEELEKRGVDYRVIGSIAVHAWLQGSEVLRSHDSPSDIDLIVPRGEQLEAARGVRRDIGESFGVKVGLSLPSTEVDLRPDAPTSFLTHRGSSIKVPVPSRLFAVRDQAYQGVPIKTVDPRTLLHTYAMPLRRQDIWKVRNLQRISITDSAYPESDYREFHDFIAACKQDHSLLETGVRLGKRIVQSLPDSMQRPVYNGIMPLAGLLGLR